MRVYLFLHVYTRRSKVNSKRSLSLCIYACFSLHQSVFSYGMVFWDEERERGRKSLRESKREKVREGVSERERVKEREKECVLERERMCERDCVKERERETERESVCVSEREVVVWPVPAAGSLFLHSFGCVDVRRALQEVPLVRVMQVSFIAVVDVFRPLADFFSTFKTKRVLHFYWIYFRYYFC